MADNLNGTSNTNQSGADGNLINDAPTQSPLEESAPAFNPSADMTQNQTMPPAPVSPEPAVDQAAPVNVQSAPPTGSETNLGESSTPPNTDEFLNSILQQQPQGQTPAPDVQAGAPAGDQMPPVIPQTPIQTEAAPPLNYPLEPKQPDTSIPTPPIANPVPEATIENQASQAPAPMPEQAPASPLTPEAPVVSQPNMPEPPQTAVIKDNISLDGLQTPVPPQPPQAADAPVSSNVFSEAPVQGGSGGMKKIILIVLVLIIIGGAYYAYSVFFGAKTTVNPAASKTKTATTASAKSVTSNLSVKDTQRKTDLAVIKDALMNYKAGSNQYPISADMIMLNKAGNILEQELVPSFLAKLPTDPDATKAYAYKSDGITFTLSAVLDDSNDAEAVMESGKALYKLTPNSSSTGTGAATNPGTASSSASSTTAGSSTFPPSSTVDDAQTSTTSDLPPTLNSNF